MTKKLDLPNDGTHIHEVLARATCDKHNAPVGVPCFHMPKAANGLSGYYAAACGGRIRHAGFNGRISPESMRTKAPTKKPSFNK